MGRSKWVVIKKQIILGNYSRVHEQRLKTPLETVGNNFGVGVQIGYYGNFCYDVEVVQHIIPFEQTAEDLLPLEN
jgi:hypothetical protein